MAMNILIVDDSSVTRAMILKVLRIAGVPIGQAFQAGNGQEGLDVLAREWVDVAFVDINMPVMNGEEMIERMRENPAWEKLPVVVVSTEGSQTRIEHIHQLGANFIHKPFSPETVKEVIQEMTGFANEHV